MISLVALYNKKEFWKDRVRILILSGWTNVQKSTLPLDNVFWTDNIHTMHYRASYLYQLPFADFYNIVYNHDITVC